MLKDLQFLDPSETHSFLSHPISNSPGERHLYLHTYMYALFCLVTGRLNSFVWSYLVDDMIVENILHTCLMKKHEKEDTTSSNQRGLNVTAVAPTCGALISMSQIVQVKMVGRDGLHSHYLSGVTL